MKRSLLPSALVVAALLGTACSSSLHATKSPGADLSRLKTLYVQRLPPDTRGIERLISDQLNRMGFQSGYGDSEIPPSPVDGIVSYQDKWMWDITMYMLQIDVQIRDPQNRMVLTAGHAMHTSLVRRSPEEMVEEVLTEIFKGEQR
ncbi:MAG TPA: hypothetical protein VFS39_03420 [Nitrospira sp.]|nr:hypothetical protein [Nitrospira sp.]